MTTVTFEEAIRIHPGNDRPSADQFDLKIEDGEFPVFIGPPSCRKSVLLRMLVGLEDVNEGHIFIGNKDVIDVLPKNHDIAMAFQNYALYPRTIVRENMGSALKIAGTLKEEIAKRVEEAIRTLDLEPYLNRKPKALFGGQCQRVMTGRTIVRKPQVSLMDEPLSGLDAKLRVQTHTQIVSLQRQLGVTAVYVIHDQTEALTMGDRAVVLKDSPLQQVGFPQEMYERPTDEFVAGFIGPPAMNLDKFEVEGSIMILGLARIPFSTTTVNALTTEDKGMIMIGFRPEGLELVFETGANPIPIQIDLVEEPGSDAFVYGHPASTDGQSIDSAEEGPPKQLTVRVPPRIAPARGGVVHIRIIASQQHNFSASTGIRLPE